MEKPRTKRKIWMKKGSYKYLLQLLPVIGREIRELRKTQRYMQNIITAPQRSPKVEKIHLDGS